MIKIAVLDDYQKVARGIADWSSLSRDAEITFFHDHLTDFDAVVARLAEFDVACIMRERTPVPRALLERLPSLRLLVTTGQRNAAVDVAAAAEHGIIVCGTTSNSDTTAELTWGLILALLRNIPCEDRAMRQGRWQTKLGVRLKGRTLGILGLGRIGAQLAQFAATFGMPVIAWSQNLTAPLANERGAQLVRKDELFCASDVLTIHLQLSSRTRHLVGAAELGLMKPTAYLVNTSRGPIIDEGALLKALSQHRIAGAALDVYDTEPLPASHPLLALDNVVLTPHLGYVTEDSYRMYYRETIEDIRAWLDGKPIRILGS